MMRRREEQEIKIESRQAADVGGSQGYGENLATIIRIMENYGEKMREFCARHQKTCKDKGSHGDSQIRRVQALSFIGYLISVSPVLTSYR